MPSSTPICDNNTYFYAKCHIFLCKTSCEKLVLTKHYLLYFQSDLLLKYSDVTLHALRVDSPSLVSTRALYTNEDKHIHPLWGCKYALLTCAWVADTISAPTRTCINKNKSFIPQIIFRNKVKSILLKTDWNFVKSADLSDRMSLIGYFLIVWA